MNKLAEVEEESYPYGIRVTERHPFTIINDTRKESLDKLLWITDISRGQNLATGTLNGVCPYDSEGPSSIEVTDGLGGYGAPAWFKNGKRGDVDRLFLVVVPEPDTVIKVSSDGGNTFKSAGNLIDGFIDIYGYKENWRNVQITHIKFEKKAA